MCVILAFRPGRADVSQREDDTRPEGYDDKRPEEGDDEEQVVDGVEGLKVNGD
jgi:hypothetical protein